MSPPSAGLTADRAAAVLGDREAVIDSLARCDERAREAVDSDLLARCERRVAELLRVEKGEVHASPLTAREQAALAFTEHWVIDVATMPDQLVSDLRDHVGDAGLADFVHALLVVEQRLRLSVAWDRLGLGVT